MIIFNKYIVGVSELYINYFEIMFRSAFSDHFVKASFSATHLLLSTPFPLYLNVMGLLSLEIFLLLIQSGDRLFMSDSDIYRRQIPEL